MYPLSIEPSLLILANIFDLNMHDLKNFLITLVLKGSTLISFQYCYQSRAKNKIAHDASMPFLASPTALRFQAHLLSSAYICLTSRHVYRPAKYIVVCLVRLVPYL